MVTKKRFHASTCPQRFAQTGAPSKQIRFRVAMQAGAHALVVMVSSPEPRQAIRPNQGLIPWAYSLPILPKTLRLLAGKAVLDRPSLWKSAQTIDRIWNRNHKYGHKVAEALRTHPIARV